MCVPGGGSETIMRNQAPSREANTRRAFQETSRPFHVRDDGNGSRDSGTRPGCKQRMIIAHTTPTFLTLISASPALDAPRGCPRGLCTNTREWTELLRFSGTGTPIVSYSWTVGQTIRPNGEVLEGFSSTSPATPITSLSPTIDSCTSIAHPPHSGSAQPIVFTLARLWPCTLFHV